MAVKTVKAGKAGKAVKPERNGRPAVKGKPVKSSKELDYEALLTKIENDPNAPPIAKIAAAYARERDKSGEPYLTIEQIFEQLGRRF